MVLESESGFLLAVMAVSPGRGDFLRPSDCVVSVQHLWPRIADLRVHGKLLIGSSLQKR